jgi:hypothetical protein
MVASLPTTASALPAKDALGWVWRHPVRCYLTTVVPGPSQRHSLRIESGKFDDRPQIAQALDICRLTGAPPVIAKLDRLSRDADFPLGL